MDARRAEVRRTTTETDIALALGLDGRGAPRCSTGIGFLDHMLELFAHHGRFDLTVRAAATSTSTATTRWKTSAWPWARRCARPWASGAGYAATVFAAAHGRGAGDGRRRSLRAPYLEHDLKLAGVRIGDFDADLTATSGARS